MFLFQIIENISGYFELTQEMFVITSTNLKLMFVWESPYLFKWIPVKYYMNSANCIT